MGEAEPVLGYPALPRGLRRKEEGGGSGTDAIPKGIPSASRCADLGMQELGSCFEAKGAALLPGGSVRLPSTLALRGVASSSW